MKTEDNKERINNEEVKKPVCGVDTIQCAHEDEKYADEYASEIYEENNNSEDEKKNNEENAG